MPTLLWANKFLRGQGKKYEETVLLQDNQSAMLLEKNGKRSSSKRTRHLDNRYFFITDRINIGDLIVRFCPTTDMVADFFTKPLQGKTFRRLRAAIFGQDP